MNRKPKPFTTYCTASPPTEIIVFCSATGVPSFMSPPMSARPSIKWRRPICTCGMLIAARRQYSIATHWAMSVATATPAMPQPNTIVNSRSSATLVSEAIIIARSGVRLSPKARSMHESRLYAIDMGMPEKNMRR